MHTNAQKKLHTLKQVLVRLESILIAFSGGVDSSLLLQAAADTPGLDFAALTTESATTPGRDLSRAREFAAALGVRHLVEKVDELQVPGYAENPANRCYLCKQTLYPRCLDAAHRLGLRYVVDGVNSDDLSDYRPGLQAAREYGVKHPLLEAGLDKEGVRALSRLYGLPTAENPASPCLSSRFPYGTAISREALARVDAAENFLRDLGFVELRVRHFEDRAKVEVSAQELPKLSSRVLCRRIRGELQALGFAHVEISREALRSGSLNSVLFSPHRK